MPPRVLLLKQVKQRMQRLMSSSRPVWAFRGRSGSARLCRPSSTMSATPEAISSSIILTSVRAPTVATGVLTCFFTSAA